MNDTQIENQIHFLNKKRRFHEYLMYVIAFVDEERNRNHPIDFDTVINATDAWLGGAGDE